MVPQWIETVALHPDVTGESFSEDIFALDFGTLFDYWKVRDLGFPEPDLRVPAVYRDPESFFRSSYLTKGLHSLLNDVLGRLSGGDGGRVLKLMTAFGGGKSHTLAALFHAARTRDALDAIPEAAGLPRPGPVRIAAFDGQMYDASRGKELPGEGIRAKTMWGWIAWCLGGREGYEMLRVQDEMRVAPGGDDLLPLLQQGPSLILLDEVLEYIISAGGIRVEKTTLRDETLSFLKRLTVAVGNVSTCALVFSLQSSKREALEHLSLLQTIDHLAARKDQRREPVEGNEILSVVQRRLLGKLPEPETATPAAQAHQQIYTQMRRSYAASDAERQQAEEEGLDLRNRIRRSYPFHPALIDLMRERWAAIPDFQRTRGALRFLAACLRATKESERSRALLGPADIPIQNADVRQAFFKEVGQREDFQACLEHDFLGSNARTKRIDDRRARETPSESGKRSATRLATAILMYSFGGLQRPGSGPDEMLPPGIQEDELLRICVGPDLDSTTAQACLKELKEQCLYLHFDGVTYCFRKDPNITLLVENEAEAISRNAKRVDGEIRTMIEERVAGHRNAIIWPSDSSKIDDNDPRFLVAYLPLDFAAKSTAEADAEAVKMFETRGSGLRSFKNGLGLAVPAEDQVEALRRSVRYLLAIAGVKGKVREHHLSDAQITQLRERESTEKAAAESALLKIYAEIWLPRSQNGGIAIDSFVAGGRPLQTTLDAQRRARIHDRVMELLTDVHRRVFPNVRAAKVVELFKLGEPGAYQHGARTSDVVAGFYSYLGFPRLLKAEGVKKAVVEGVEKGLFGYAPTKPSLGAEDRFEIPRHRVAFERTLPEDEVDLDSGFLVVPAAMPEAAAPPPGPAPGPVAESVDPPPLDDGGPEPPPPPPGRRDVRLTFSADRQKLFNAWNALANLAEQAGSVRVTVEANSLEGFDQNKLENGVLEPLREIGLID